MLVVDASVALRWYVEAQGSEEAIALLEGEDVMIAPDLVVAEVANAAWKLARRREISPEHGSRIAAAVSSAFARTVPASSLIGRAYRMASALEHPVYDCLYLSLAESESAQMVTADSRLIETVMGSSWEKRVRPLLPG
jgi:predicted nucleic acid-binding protein